MKILLVLWISITLLMQSCCSTVACQTDTIKIYLISFTPTDTDTIILRRFNPNTNFQNLNDTLLLRNSNSLISIVSADTSSVSIWDNASFKLNPSFDYEIFIPSVNSTTKVFNITEVKSEQKQCFVSDGQGPCYNLISSFSQNGLIKVGQILFIKK